MDTGCLSRTTTPNDYERSARAVVRTWKTTVEPATEPLTLAALKLRLRITECDDDIELSQLLTHARKQVEADTYRRLIQQTVVGYMDGFPRGSEIELRLAPISSVTSITYIDQAGATQTLPTTAYHADLTSTPPRILLKTSQQWEEVEENTPNSVLITCVAGYGTAASSVPVAAVLAIVEYARMMWEHCEGDAAVYQRLISSLQWTAYHRVMA